MDKQKSNFHQSAQGVGHVYTHTRTRAHTHAHARAHTHTHTHDDAVFFTSFTKLCLRIIALLIMVSSKLGPVLSKYIYIYAPPPTDYKPIPQKAVVASTEKQASERAQTIQRKSFLRLMHGDKPLSPMWPQPRNQTHHLHQAPATEQPSRNSTLVRGGGPQEGAVGGWLECTHIFGQENQISMYRERD